MKISTIVPVYNVEKYLTKCIDSIINQTYKDLEIILVDDGSTDNSGQICDQYAKKDNRIKVIHKENGGLSDARNVGIKNSTGEYLSFIDSDDYIDKDMIECLYNAITNTNSDIAVCGKYIEGETGKYYLKNVNSQLKIYDSKEALKSILTNNLIDVSACDKLFIKTLFKDIQFPKNKYFEDMGTIYKLIDLCNSIVHIGSAKYHYIQRQDSITKTKFDMRYNDLYEHMNQLIELINKKYNYLTEYVLSYQLQNLITIITEYHNSINEDKENYIEIRNKAYKELKNNKKNILKSKKIKLTKKIMMILILKNQIGIINKLKKMR